ncbi:MAG: hypothetical protein ACJAQ3_000370, partial [Planctomycetota bacterium]
RPRRTGVLPHGPPRRRGREGEPRAGPHEPYGPALWPGRPADARGGFGLGDKTQDPRPKTQDSPMRAGRSGGTEPGGHEGAGRFRFLSSRVPKGLVRRSGRVFLRTLSAQARILGRCQELYADTPDRDTCSCFAAYRDPRLRCAGDLARGFLCSHAARHGDRLPW